MKKVVVLGAGMVGRAIALDLCSTYQVTSVDVSQEALQLLQAKNSAVHTICQDLSQLPKIRELVQEYDLVIGAVPGFMGYRVLQTLIEAGKNVVDISFFPEDSLTLDELAKKHQVTAIVDCGVAPGMSNLMLGYYASHIDVTDFECLVGGLPVAREWPYEYKAPFSPSDVLEEYTRPARYVENGYVVTKPALSDPELVFFPGIGTLESFNTDGLRSLIKTFPQVPNMKEKTLRYPGHIRYIQALIATGFLNSEPINIDSHSIRPIDFTSRLLFKKWKLNPGEEEFTVMRITIKGSKNSHPKHIVYDMLDRYNPATGLSSMARTTGFTATAAANLLLEGKFNTKGIIPPEYLGRDEICFQAILDYLEQRRIVYVKKELV